MMQKMVNKKEKKQRVSWFERRENDLRDRARRFQNLTLEQSILLQRW